MKTVQVGGDTVQFPDGMSDAEIEKVLQEHYKPQPSAAQKRLDAMPSFVQALLGTGEAGLQAATGLAGSVAGGIAGLADAGLSLAGGGSGAPGDTVRSVQRAVTYQPRTTQGKGASDLLGLPMELYAKAVRAGGDAVRGGDSGGARDFLGTTVDVGGESLPAILGGVGAIKALRNAPKPVLTPQEQVLADAQKEGFTVQPSLMGKSSYLEGAGGKYRTAQTHSANNAEQATRVAVEELKLPKDAVLTPATFDAYRDILYQRGYVPLKQRATPMAADQQYWADVSKPLQELRKVESSFPDAKVAGAGEIQSLTDGMMNVNKIGYEAAVERIRQLRFESKSEMRDYSNPAQMNLGIAKRNAADALEKLMERDLARSGDQGLLKSFRDAREYIAKSHTIEDATNPATGVVDARALAKKDAPLTGKLKVMSDFATAFPKAVQRVESFGGTPPISPLDVTAAQGAGLLGAAATGNPGALAMGGIPLLRPLAAPMTKSGFVQRGLVPRPGIPPQFGLLPLLDPEQQQLR